MTALAGTAASAWADEEEGSQAYTESSPRERRPAAVPIRRTTSRAPGMALLALGRWLRQSGYEFVTTTPESHRRVNTRGGNAEAQCLRGVFGWSRPFRKSLLPPRVFDLLEAAGGLQRDGMLYRSSLRASCLDDMLLWHTAYPTDASDSVFFGPDTHRFVSLIRRALDRPSTAPIHCAVEIGCGTGAGGIAAARMLDRRDLHRVVLSDINPRALGLARINANLNGVLGVECVQSDVLCNVAGPIDLILANPPYLMDPAERVYRNGGGQWGCELALRMVRESIPRLAPGGSLIMYAGSAVVSGQDIFRLAVEPVLKAAQASYRYIEIDPDVFGEELDSVAYASVERIAAVGLIAHKPEALS